MNSVLSDPSDLSWTVPGEDARDAIVGAARGWLSAKIELDDAIVSANRPESTEADLEAYFNAMARVAKAEESLCMACRCAMPDCGGKWERCKHCDHAPKMMTNEWRSVYMTNPINSAFPYNAGGAHQACDLLPEPSEALNLSRPDAVMVLRYLALGVDLVYVSGSGWRFRGSSPWVAIPSGSVDDADVEWLLSRALAHRYARGTAVRISGAGEQYLASLDAAVHALLRTWRPDQYSTELPA